MCHAILDLGRIARNDHTLFICGVLGGITRMKKLREQYEQIAIAEQKDPARVKVGVARLAFVSKNKKDVDHYIDCAL